MRDTLRDLDRLDIRARDRALTWSLTPGTYRVAEAALVVIVLVAFVILTVLQHGGQSLAVLSWIVARLALGQLRHRGSLFDAPAVDAAMGRLPGIGRQVRQGHWRVEGPAARAFAVQLEQWRAPRAAPVALTPAEPENIPTESYEPGQPWPLPPAELADSWPLMGQGESQ